MKKTVSLILFACLFLPAMAIAQTISGTVTDKNTGEPIPSANLLIAELSRGTATDLDGNYTISNLEAGMYTIRVTYIGYVTINETVQVSSGNTVVNFELEPDVTGLEEVVVTGIASRSSKAVAEVAISKVKVSDLTADKSYQDVSQVLSGKVAGVNVQPASGQVGGGIRFNIRSGGGLNGNGQPVIFIDGIRVDNSQIVGYGSGGQGVGALADLNPEDIADIQILKGPAGAALYGTSGSNGVVIITTKRGQTSNRGVLKLDVKSRFGFNEQAVEYDENDILSYNKANEIFVRGAVRQNTVGISGGNDFIRYFTQFDVTDEEGILPNNTLNRNSFRANFDVFPAENLTMSVSTGFTLNEVDRPQNDNNIFGYLGNVVLAPFGDTGVYNFTDSTAIADIRNVTSTNRFIGSFKLEYEPIENLFLTGSVGFDGSDNRQDQFNLPHRSNPDGSRDLFVRENEQFTYDLNARYQFEFDEFTFNSLLGTQIFDRKVRTSFISRSLFQTNLITSIDAGANIDDAGEAYTHVREAGVFFQQEINWANKLFVTVGGRQDYASAVGFDAPNIFYPKASAAIRVDEFDVLPSSIDFFKLRVAYGETGILPGSLSGQPLLWGASNSGFGVGATIATIGNAQIQPERVRELEFGVEATFLKNYSIDFSYYLQKSEDSIIGLAQAPSTGLIASDVPFNVGEIEGQGFELALNMTPWLTRNNQLDLTFLWSHQTNEVINIGGVQPIRDGFDLNTIQPGLPRSTFFPFRVDGANFTDQGVYNGPNIATGEDGRVALGQPYPENQFSFSANLRFAKNFNLFALAEWQTGVTVFNNTALFASIFRNNPRYEELRGLLGFSSAYNSNDNDADDITPLVSFDANGNPTFTNQAAYTEAANEYATMTTNSDFGYVEDADFLRIREVSLSYNAMDLIKRSSALSNAVKKLTLSVSVRNLALFTDYSGVDPEVNFAGARSASRGQDFLTLQNPRVYNASISIGF